MATFRLKPSAPFRLDLTVWVLRRLAINQMDDWDGRTYRRVLVVGDTPIELEVNQSGPMHRPEITVVTHGGRVTGKTRDHLISMLEKMLGLRVDLKPFYKMAQKDRRLAKLTAPFIGFKPPRLASVFETMLTGIACQQVSLAAGIHFLNRMSSAFGLSVGEHHAFPRPVDLVAAKPEQLRAIGFSGRKAQTILTTAQAIVERRLDLEALSTLGDSSAIRQLLQLKGIGRWTAEYILLRGLGRLDVFPGDDVGGQAKAQRWLSRKTRPDYDAMYRILSPWHPYRGIIYFYLLLDHQKRLGLFS